jgi:hypothetical protein
MTGPPKSWRCVSTSTPAKAAANLTEATKVMGSLQPQVAALLGPKELRGWIRQAQARH